jgi:hypothetical protein
LYKKSLKIPMGVATSRKSKMKIHYIRDGCVRVCSSNV